jgi:hypothetical protein
MGMKNGHQIGYNEAKAVLKTLWLQNTSGMDFF